MCRPPQEANSTTLPGDLPARLKGPVELVFPVRRLAPDGLEAWKQVLEGGYEGYVAKDEASSYEGGPTRRWLKVKQKDWTVEGMAGGGGSARRSQLADRRRAALADAAALRYALGP